MAWIDLVLNVLSFACAYYAAILWVKSAKAKVPDSEDGRDTGNPEIIVDGMRFIESAKLQSKLSAHAAYAAGAAAVFQGGSIFLKIIDSSRPLF